MLFINILKLIKMDEEIGKVYIWWASPDQIKDKHIVITGSIEENGKEFYTVKFLRDGRINKFPKWHLEKWKGNGDWTQCAFKILFDSEDEYYESLIQEEENKIEQSRMLIESHKRRFNCI